MSLTDSTPATITTAGNPTVQLPEPPAPGRLVHGGFVHGLLTNKKALFGLAILVLFRPPGAAGPRPGTGRPLRLRPRWPPWHHPRTTCSEPPPKARTCSPSPCGDRAARCSSDSPWAWRRPSSACLVGLASAYFGKAIDEATLAADQRLPAPARAAAPGDPRRIPAAGARHRRSSSWSSPAGQGRARVLRSQALSIRSKDFVAAAVVTGETGLAASCSGKSCPTWPPSS